MKHFIKALRKNVIWFSISIQYLVAFFFIYASFIFPTPELKIATGGLAVAFAVMASTDIKGIKDAKKVDKILTKLDEVLDKLDTYHSNKSQTA